MSVSRPDRPPYVSTAVGLVVVAAATLGLIFHEPGETASSADPETDGVIPDGATASDIGYPGVGNLDPALLEALQAATAAAAADGIVLEVTSGWRSPELQAQLFDEAVTQYGTETEAARWVATADTSAHVAGDAVDIGPLEAMLWMSQHGVEHGLCQTYANERWHFELHPEAVGSQCPIPYADPTEDPRMQQR